MLAPLSARRRANNYNTDLLFEGLLFFQELHARSVDETSNLPWWERNSTALSVRRSLLGGSELVAACTRQKPIIALVDPDASRGGMSLDEVHARLQNAESSNYGRWGFDRQITPSAAALYDQLTAREPIEWNRIGHFRAALPENACAQRKAAACAAPERIEHRLACAQRT